MPTTAHEMLPAPASSCLKRYVWGRARDKTHRRGDFMQQIVSAKEYKKDRRLFFPNALVCLKKGEGGYLSPLGSSGSVLPGAEPSHQTFLLLLGSFCSQQPPSCYVGIIIPSLGLLSI